MRQIGFLKDEELNSKSVNKSSSSAIIPCDFTHAVIIGETGCGKTTAMIYPNLLDRIKRGHGIFIIDYKGCEHLRVKALAKQAGRLKDVVCVGSSIDTPINFIIDMKTKDFKQSLTASMKERDNSFWSEFGSNIATNTFEVLRAISLYHKIIEYKDRYLDFNFYIKIKALVGSYYPNFATIVDLSQDIEKMRIFMDKLKEVIHTRDKLKRHDKIMYDELKIDTMIFIKKIRAFLNSVNRFKKSEGSDERVFGDFRNYSMMMTPFLSMMNNPSLNSKEGSIASMLKQSKIVVFNASCCDKGALNLILASFLPSLTNRVSDTNKINISVFLDEAAKLLNEDSELEESILRENKVELIISFQNPYLMKLAIGEIRYEALFGNLTNRYFMKNKVECKVAGRDIECSGLDKFECIDNNSDKIKLDPMFIDTIKEDEAQMEYESINSIHQRVLGRVFENCIIKQDSELMERGRVKLMNLKNKEIQEKPLSMQFIKEHLDIEWFELL